MIVIYHNPACGTSRNVLRCIEAAGYELQVIEYLQVGWTRPQLLGLLAAMDLTPRQILRIRNSPAESLGLLDDAVTDEDLISAMCKEPILVDRPIVCTPLGIRLCRPSETVLDVLSIWPAGPFAKEDGQLVIDADGQPHIVQSVSASQ